MDLIPEALCLPKGMGRARILECFSFCAQNLKQIFKQGLYVVTIDKL
jgi:hypothetical protein